MRSTDEGDSWTMMTAFAADSTMRDYHVTASGAAFFLASDGSKGTVRLYYTPLLEAGASFTEILASHLDESLPNTLWQQEFVGPDFFTSYRPAVGLLGNDSGVLAFVQFGQGSLAPLVVTRFDAEGDFVSQVTHEMPTEGTVQIRLNPHIAVGDPDGRMVLVGTADMTTMLYVSTDGFQTFETLDLPPADYDNRNWALPLIQLVDGRFVLGLPVVATHDNVSQSHSDRPASYQVSDDGLVWSEPVPFREHGGNGQFVRFMTPSPDGGFLAIVLDNQSLETDLCQQWPGAPTQVGPSIDMPATYECPPGDPVAVLVAAP